MRTLTAEQTAALEAGVGGLRFTCTLTLASGTYRFWDEDHGTLTLDGADYIGAGAFASFSGVPSGDGLAAARFQTTLDGTRLVSDDVAGDPASVLASFHEEDYKNRPIDFQMVLFDQASTVVFALPILSGIITGAPLSIGPVVTLTVEAQTRSGLLSRSNGAVRSSAHQRGLYAGDTGLDFVADTVNGESSLWWGPQATRRSGGGDVDGGPGGPGAPGNRPPILSPTG
jgi:hypothetical protein